MLFAHFALVTLTFYYYKICQSYSDPKAFNLCYHCLDYFFHQNIIVLLVLNYYLSIWGQWQTWEERKAPLLRRTLISQVNQTSHMLRSPSSLQLRRAKCFYEWFIERKQALGWYPWVRKTVVEVFFRLDFFWAENLLGSESSGE